MGGSLHTVGCYACDIEIARGAVESHEATEHHRRMQERLDRLERYIEIDTATAAAEMLRRRGYTRCPRCTMQWIAPATPHGGPMVPVQLEACPRCGAKDPAAMRRDAKYQQELDEARKRNNAGLGRASRRAAAAAIVDGHFPHLAANDAAGLRAELAKAHEQIRKPKKRKAAKKR